MNALLQKEINYVIINIRYITNVHFSLIKKESKVCVDAQLMSSAD
jgi:hypothetical protein